MDGEEGAGMGIPRRGWWVRRCGRAVTQLSTPNDLSNLNELALPPRDVEGQVTPMYVTNSPAKLN